MSDSSCGNSSVNLSPLEEEYDYSPEPSSDQIEDDPGEPLGVHTGDSDITQDIGLQRDELAGISEIHNYLSKYSTTSTVYAEQSISHPDYQRTLYW